MGFLKKIVEWLNPQENILEANLPGRNDICRCGSGKKYKKCHLDEDAHKLSKARAMNCRTS